MRMSKTFLEKWLDMYGFRPDPDDLKEMVDNSVYVQRSHVVRRDDGEIFRVAEIRWDPVRNIIFKIDGERRRLITFIGSK